MERISDIFQPGRMDSAAQDKPAGGFSLRFVSDGATTIPYAWFERRGEGTRSHSGNGRILAFPVRLKEGRKKGKISESEIVLQGGKLKHVTWS